MGEYRQMASDPNSRAVVAEDERVSCSQLSVRRNGTTLLDDITLSAYPGEILSVVGPNGAGKSTLLSAIAGDFSLSHGSVSIEGQPIKNAKPLHLARLRSMMTQSNLVGFSFTVAEVISMGRAPWRRTNEQKNDQIAIDNAVEVCDVGAFLTRPFSSLSGGEQSRVSLARILAQQTPTILLDEPTAALDIKYQEDVMDIVQKRSHNGDTVIIVVHDLSLAAAYSDRVAVLKSGHLVGVDSPENILTNTLISTVYGCAVEVLHTPHSGLVVAPIRTQLANTDLSSQA